MLTNILRAIGLFFLDIIEAVVTALAIFVIIWLFFFQAHEVKGSSMVPTLENGDYLVTDKISYRFREPARDDIIVLHSPKSQDDYIKRILGLPGETVEIKNNQILINGDVILEDYLPEGVVTYGGLFLKEDQPQTISEGRYLVLGDNRLHSSDGRDFGPIDRGAIVGRAVFRYWPANKLGLINKKK